ncbi:Gfo/Idh/MocA family protein [Paenibacillus thermotolerans]|uniref:Gfo/Idh/MocA family protein n=1 Tax=Paenibacillus thermotolerans TaxID=3027807 RepID=UPI002368AEFA|nr:MULTISPECIES: Gfo/Idh/MocA family oxidoreductase [unclassified Paenibacillus]
MVQEQRLKIGLVGASWFSDLWYLPAIQLHPNADIHAICSEGGESAQRMSEKYGIPHVYTSYERMLEEAGLDGVCIVTPNVLHAPVAEAAMRKGIHVICEKPLAMNAEEAARMAAAAETSKVLHSVNFTYREHPGIQRMKAMVAEGAIGDIHSGYFEYSGEYGITQPPGWRGAASKGGIGGVLADLGSHLIDLAQFVTGTGITEVCGEARFAHADRYDDAAADSVSFLARFADGMRGTFHTSWLEHQGGSGQTIRLELTGLKGKLRFAAGERGCSLQYAPHREAWSEVAVTGAIPLDEQADPSEERFRPWRLTDRNEVWKWIDAILERKSGSEAFGGASGASTGSAALSAAAGLATFADGSGVQAVMDAVMRSAQEHKWIAVK